MLIKNVISKSAARRWQISFIKKIVLQESSTIIKIIINYALSTLPERKQDVQT